MAKRYYKDEMIKENESSPSNLPQDKVHKNYPSSPTIGGTYGDDRSSIDRQISDDVKKTNRNVGKGEKY